MKKKSNQILSLILVGIVGAVAMIAQVSYIRFSSSSFYGNELTMCVVLGHWLLWTGIGSRIASSLVNKLNTRKTLLSISLLYIVTLLLFSYMLFVIREIVGISLSEIVGFGPIFFYTLLILAIPCIINGFFFPFLVNWVKSNYSNFSIHLVYIFEVFGSAIGSLLFAGLLFLGSDTFTNLHIILSIFLIISIISFCKEKSKKTIGISIGLIALLLLSLSSKNYLLKIKWKPLEVEEYIESPYLSLTISSYEDRFTLYGDSEPLWTFGEIESAEERVHFGLLACPSPKNVLIIGTGNAQIIREIEKHQSIQKVMVIQQDGILQKVLDKYSADSVKCEVNYIINDPVTVLKRDSIIYDVALLNIPTPVNAQWNRFYTIEFLELLKDALSENGVVCLHFPGGENFLIKEHIEFLKTMSNTANEVFRYVTWIPGETAHLLASDIPIDNSYEATVGKLKERNIKNIYVQDYYLLDRLSPMKIDFLENNIESCKINDLNSLISPIGYYYDTILWDQQTGGALKTIYKFLRQTPPLYILSAIAIFIVILITYFRVSGKTLSLIHYNMAAIGFTELTLETAAIIIFQSYVGGVYLKIVFLTFAFMLGCGIGALAHLKIFKSAKFTQLISQIGLLTFLPLLVLFILQLDASSSAISFLIILILFFCGLAHGMIFPILSLLSEKLSIRSISSSAGRVYSWDVIGSCLGAYFVSGIVIPVWGINITLIFLFMICLITLVGNLMLECKEV
jgi:predicted membrane-bound spermidine synthase